MRRSQELEDVDDARDSLRSKVNKNNVCSFWKLKNNPQLFMKKIESVFESEMLLQVQNNTSSN